MNSPGPRIKPGVLYVKTIESRVWHIDWYSVRGVAYISFCGIRSRGVWMRCTNTCPTADELCPTCATEYAMDVLA